jgi:hypothetical protein
VNTVPNARATLSRSQSPRARPAGTRHPTTSIINHHTRALRRTGGSSFFRIQNGTYVLAVRAAQNACGLRWSTQRLVECFGW